MERQPLDIYDVRPPAMENYLRYNGRHFTEKLCKFAVSNMRKRNRSTGKSERVEMIGRSRFDELMKAYGITIENDVLCDGLYVLNMAMADFYGSSLPDESSVGKFVRDYIDDEDAVDGFVFNRYYADTVLAGIPIPWEEVL